ncbi:preprotein translocase subunit SecB [uncultured Clostridium sp.]|jgi:preprotein translocase subunit SecB|nr:MULTISPECIES: protein-export chaperone SecB [unclassified Clostridium]RHO37629.1 preprotein translocase subunit SecB [Clostridium sp. AM16-23]RHR04350.1 preprotein translocase subunit SecB [Clostridium sp. AF20-17LB]RHV94759.1 preprotein translocase subunit SecB [Clostridium sp. OF09-10]SCH49794.1 preprotein translocase subunit SecB [uncultured Clostridium sp.]
MNIATNYESPLVLKNIMITEGTFKRSEDSLEDVELQVNVSHNVNQISDREYKIILELSVADPQGKLSVFVKGMAIFETEQKTRTLIERNTLAIMFPYFRSYVSTLTTQPGMMPIVLPAMNIIAMLTEKDK